MKTIHLKIFQILIIGIIVSCVNTNKPSLDNSRIIYIYNPLENELTVKIDNDKVNLPPMDAYPIQLLYGNHLFEFGELIDSFKIDTNTNLVINPVRDTLITAEIIYVPNDMDDVVISEDNYEREFVGLNIDRLTYYGPFKITNEFFIYDWDYGPGHPVNTQLTEYSSVKTDLEKISSVIKVYNIPEFYENYISINHSEEYIKEILPRYLTKFTDDVNIEINGDALSAGIGKNMFGLADIHVTSDEKLNISFWEKYNPSVHGELKETKFTISDCIVEIDNKITQCNVVEGISVTKSDFLVLIAK